MAAADPEKDPVDPGLDAGCDRDDAPVSSEPYQEAPIGVAHDGDGSPVPGTPAGTILAPQ